MNRIDTCNYQNHTLEEIVACIGNGENRSNLYRSMFTEQERLDPTVNAIENRSNLIPTDASEPFNGLPITVKDQIAVNGWPRWFGLERKTKKPESYSEPLVHALEKMGCTVQAKTALPPYGLDLQTFNKRRGYTENPHGVGFTTGGSSGGGSAAVASGMSLLDVGADMAGSLRLPAGWCGVTSLVPTEGKFDNIGMLQGRNSVKHFARTGPITRTAVDLAFVWQTLTQQAIPSVTTSPLNIRVFDSALSKNTPIEAGFDEYWRAFVESLHKPASNLVSSGFSDLLADRNRKLFGEIMGHEASEHIPYLVRWLMRRDRKAIQSSPAFLRYVYAGYYRNDQLYRENIAALNNYRSLMFNTYSDTDVLLMPVSGIQAFRHVIPARDKSGIRTYNHTFDTKIGKSPFVDALTHFTVPVGLLGWPVVTLPFTRDNNGIPLGLQVVGKPNQEAKLLAIAIWLEKLIAFNSPDNGREHVEK